MLVKGSDRIWFHISRLNKELVNGSIKWQCSIKVGKQPVPSPRSTIAVSELLPNYCGDLAYMVVYSCA